MTPRNDPGLNWSFLLKGGTLQIQYCFWALSQNGEITHTWNDLNVASWDLDDVLLNPIQYDRCGDFFHDHRFVYFFDIVCVDYQYSSYQCFVRPFYH
jgi:hypothetical protein